MTRSVPARLGLICGFAAASIALTGVARAEEGVAVKDLLGTIGIIPKSKDSIQYRERAPLVLPPKTELRQPGRGARASANPAWPNDPDVAARRRTAEENAAPVTWSEKRRMSEENNLRLTPKEIQAGRSASHAASVPGSHRGDSARDVLYLSPDQLRAKAVDDTPDTAGGVPTRRSLTEPPTEMRRWAGGKAIRGDFAPKIDQQALDANPMTWLTRKFKSEDDD